MFESKGNETTTKTKMQKKKKKTTKENGKNFQKKKQITEPTFIDVFSKTAHVQIH